MLITDTNKMQLNLRKSLVEEYAVAITINGINYAVMMLSPFDLEDFVVGFLFTEQVIEHRYDVHDIEISLDDEQSTAIINVQIANRCLSKLKGSTRQTQGNSGCGVCGVKALEQAMPKVKKLSPIAPPDAEQLLALKPNLSKWQTIGKDSGAMHAAFLLIDNNIVACKEDIGRHNSLDKIIGFKLNNKQFEQIEQQTMAILVTSRCSVELVHKTVIAQIGTLISLASPSSLAVKIAKSANLNLVHIPKYDQPEFF